jgi:hypothetical protein
MKTLGVDIGGANLKAADNDGCCRHAAFPLWQAPEQLPHRLAELFGTFGAYDLLAVAMTAELADCFPTKEAGVDAVLAAVEEAAGSTPIAVWQTGAEFVVPEVARTIPRLVSAANWHALATWVGRMVPRGSAILIDVGSTTTDVVPLRDGFPVARGMTDLERLLSGELIYTGERRTPLCAVSGTVVLRGRTLPVAAELFATTLDVGLLLGDTAENAQMCETADGREATSAAAHARIARMVCADQAELTFAEAQDLARQFRDAQVRQIGGALRTVLKSSAPRCEHLILSGSGTHVARAAAEHAGFASLEPLVLDEVLGPADADSACALALAHLAAERCRHVV